MKQFKVDGHEDSWLPENKNWKLVWNDEFDGTQLDRTKWDYRLCMMGKRHRTWVENGVELDGNSNAVFKIFEKNGEICSSQLQTGYNFMDEPVDLAKNSFGGGFTWSIGKLHENKFLHKYGYYECRCKLQKKEGWWSAFWLQSPTIGCSINPEEAGIENDIMESFHPGEVAHHVNHYGGYGTDHKSVIHGETKHLNLDVYHRFGMLWRPDGYTFYVDGQKTGHSNAPVSKREQFILISTEVNGYRTDTQTATDEARAAVGDEFIVDYVRVFDEIDL